MAQILAIDGGPGGRPVSVEPLGEGGRRDWDAYVAGHENSSIYHLSGWQDIVASVFGHEPHYLIAREANEVAGVLPLVRLRSRLFGDYLAAMPFFNYGGAIGDSPETEGRLMEEACRVAYGLGCSHVEFRDTVERQGWLRRTDKVGMKLDLPERPDELWDSLGSKKRNRIRRPLREQVEVVHGHAGLLDEFYRVFSRNMRDLGTPVYAKKLFVRIAESFPGNTYISVIRLRGKPVAAGFLIGYRRTLEIPWAASLREVNHLKVNMLLYWEMLKRAIELGYRQFDFGRSTKGGGTYEFKKQWGATERPLHWHYWVKSGSEPPMLTPANPKYRMAIRVWQHLPLPIANWIGPGIVKNLP